MNRLLDRVRSTGALVLLLALAGCVGYEEELWLEPDGSGRLHFEMRLASLLATQMQEDLSPERIREELSGVEGIRVEQVRSYETATHHVVAVGLAFDDWQRLAQLRLSADGKRRGILQKVGLETLLGRVSVETDAQGRMVFRRTIGVERQGEDSGTEDYQALAAQALLGDFTWKYTTHFPRDIVSANAPHMDLETRTLTWEYGVASLMQEPKTMEVTLVKPRTWPLYLGGVVALLALAGLVGLVFGRARKAS